MTPTEVVFLFDVDNTNCSTTTEYWTIFCSILSASSEPHGGNVTLRSSKSCASDSVMATTWGCCSATGSKPLTLPD